MIRNHRISRSITHPVGDVIREFTLRVSHRLLSLVKKSNRQRCRIRSHHLQFELAAFEVCEQKRDLLAALLEAEEMFGSTESSGIHVRYAVLSLLRVTSLLGGFERMAVARKVLLKPRDVAAPKTDAVA
jgi:hypothetical protein